MSEAGHIFQIAKRTGGQAILAACGEDGGTEMLRDAISAFAQDGGAAYVNDTIVSLFGEASSLSDDQLGELGTALVENFQP